MYFLYEDYMVNNKFGLECSAIAMIQSLSTNSTFPVPKSTINGQVAIYPDTLTIRNLIIEGKDLAMGTDGMPSIVPLETKYINEEIASELPVTMEAQNEVKISIVAKALATTVDKIAIMVI
ncbi:MAG: hypothetical protein ACRC6B_06160 [Fusobacteriaceae bacterium]